MLGFCPEACGCLSVESWRRDANIAEWFWGGYKQTNKHIRYSYHFLSPLNGPVSFARENLKGGGGKWAKFLIFQSVSFSLTPRLRLMCFLSAKGPSSWRSGRNAFQARLMCWVSAKPLLGSNSVSSLAWCNCLNWQKMPGSRITAGSVQPNASVEMAFVFWQSGVWLASCERAYYVSLKHI